MSTNTQKAHVARLHFVRGLTRSEIGERLGLSRFKVARLLEEARAEGIVRIEIADDVAQADDLAARLEAVFGLDHAVVTRAADDVARATAALLPSLLRPGDVVGVAWGETLRAVIDALPPLGTGQAVVQICGAIPGLETGIGPSEVALGLAQRLGGAVALLPAPARSDATALLLENDAVRPTVELFDRVTLALVGIGAHPSGGGHVLVHVFDAEGRVLAPEPSIALPLERLQAARVLAAAGGTPKHAAVLAALRSGLLDVLATDDATARYALEHA